MENKVIAKEYVDKNFIHKDKIRNKIKEEIKLLNGYDKNEMWLASCSETIIEVLQSLLEDK